MPAGSPFRGSSNKLKPASSRPLTCCALDVAQCYQHIDGRASQWPAVAARSWATGKLHYRQTISADSQWELPACSHSCWYQRQVPSVSLSDGVTDTTMLSAERRDRLQPVRPQPKHSRWPRGRPIHTICPRLAHRPIDRHQRDLEYDQHALPGQ